MCYSIVKYSMYNYRHLMLIAGHNKGLAVKLKYVLTIDDTIRRHCSVFAILAPFINILTCLLTYLLRVHARKSLSYRPKTGFRSLTILFSLSLTLLRPQRITRYGSANPLKSTGCNSSAYNHNSQHNTVYTT